MLPASLERPPASPGRLPSAPSASRPAPDVQRTHREGRRLARRRGGTFLERVLSRTFLAPLGSTLDIVVSDTIKDWQLKRPEAGRGAPAAAAARAAESSGCSPVLELRSCGALREIQSPPLPDHLPAAGQWLLPSVSEQQRVQQTSIVVLVHRLRPLLSLLSLRARHLRRALWPQQEQESLRRAQSGRKKRSRINRDTYTRVVRSQAHSPHSPGCSAAWVSAQRTRPVEELPPFCEVVDPTPRAVQENSQPRIGHDVRIRWAFAVGLACQVNAPC